MATLPQGEVPWAGGHWGGPQHPPGSASAQEGKPRAGHGGRTCWSHPGCALGTCPPWLRAQLLCDALWGHKGRLFRGPRPAGLPQHGGKSQGVHGDRLFLGMMPRVARVPQLVGGCGGAGGLPHSCVRGLGCPFSCPLPQVGCFDPYSDDPRLGVQKIALCKYTAKMVVAGTAGQVGWQGQSRGCQAPLGSPIGDPWHEGAADPHGCP